MTEQMEVPNEAAWGDWASDLDLRSAHDDFAGKTAPEAIALFAGNVLWYGGEVRWMPPDPFRFYVLAFAEYVLSDACRANDEASNAANVFLGVVCERLASDSASVVPVMPSLLVAVQHLAEHQVDYDADPEIYGSFQERAATIRTLWQQHEVRQG